MENQRTCWTNALLYGPAVGMFVMLANGLIVVYYAIFLIVIGLCSLATLCVIKSNNGKKIARSLVNASTVDVWRTRPKRTGDLFRDREDGQVATRPNTRRDSFHAPLK